MEHSHHTGRTCLEIHAILKLILKRQKRAREEKRENLPILNDLHEDTIPFHLFSSDTMEPVYFYDQAHSFKTWYFRIEEELSDPFKVKLSLLKPCDELGYPADS